VNPAATAVKREAEEDWERGPNGQLARDCLRLANTGGSGPPSLFPLEEYGAGCRIRTNDLRFTKPDNGFRCAQTGPAMVSIRTVCRHCLANARVCPCAALWGDHTGETMPKKIIPSFTPCPLALADRDRREALRDQQSLTATFFGDPLPGVSALDRRERERPSLTTLVPAV
jgi:hypothetical protein